MRKLHIKKNKTNRLLKVLSEKKKGHAHHISKWVLPHNRVGRKSNVKYSKTIFTEDASGQLYLAGVVEYFFQQQELYKEKSYAEFERDQLRRHLETASENFKSNFTQLLSESKKG